MKKLLLAAAVTAAAFLLASNRVQAATGVFGSYIGINPNAAGNTWYVAQAPGSVSLASFNRANLGSFNLSQTPSLFVSAWQLETFKNGGGDVTGAALFYRVYQQGSTRPIFTQLNGNFIANSTFTDAGGVTITGSGDQLWGQNPTGTYANVLNGISVSSLTTYELEIYFRATSNEGDRFSNNGGLNYVASFNVIPEPSTYALLGLGALTLGGYALRRRKRY